MEAPVKERLVGAALLVGLIVILVPEILSGPGEDIRAQEGDEPLRTYTIDLSAPGELPQEVEPAATALPAPPPESSAGTPPARAASTGQDSSTAPGSSAANRTPVPPPASPEPTNEPPSAGWAVQIGSFANADNARRLVKELRQQGYTAFIASSGSGARARHKVRIGPQGSRAQADRLAERLKREGRQVAVVSHP